MAHPLQLPAAERLRTWSHLVDQIEAYARDVDRLRVAPPLDPAVLALAPKDHEAAPTFSFSRSFSPGLGGVRMMSSIRPYSLAASEVRK